MDSQSLDCSGCKPSLSSQSPLALWPPQRSGGLLVLSPQPGLLESLELGARKGHSEEESSGVKDLDQGPVPKFLLLSRGPLVDDHTSP